MIFGQNYRTQGTIMLIFKDIHIDEITIFMMHFDSDGKIKQSSINENETAKRQDILLYFRSMLTINNTQSNNTITAFELLILKIVLNQHHLRISFIDLCNHIFLRDYHLTPNHLDRLIENKLLRIKDYIISINNDYLLDKYKSTDQQSTTRILYVQSLPANAYLMSSYQGMKEIPFTPEAKAMQTLTTNNAYSLFDSQHVTTYEEDHQEELYPNLSSK